MILSVSEEKKPKEQKELATNRLLDLLRSQQAGTPDDIPEAVKEKAAKESQPEEKDGKPIAVTIEDGDQSSATESPIVDDKTLVPELEDDTAVDSEEQISSQELLESLADALKPKDEPVLPADEPQLEALDIEQHQPTADPDEFSQNLFDVLKSKTGTEETPVSEKIAPDQPAAEADTVSPEAGEEEIPDLTSETPIPKSVEEPKKTPLPDQPESLSFDDQGPGVGDLLSEIQVSSAEAIGESEASEHEVAPHEFNSRLFVPLPQSYLPTKNELTLNFIKRYLNESRYRFSIVIEKKAIQVLELETTKSETIIRFAHSYEVPFQAGDEVLYHVEDLLDYILEKEIRTTNRKSLHGAVYYEGVNTRTKVFQTPVVKKSEMKDLVAWNIKKTIPFKPDEAAISWGAAPDIVDSNKQSVVVGAAERATLESLISKYKNYKIKLRLFSTIPILIWKNFIHNYPDFKAGAYAIVYIGHDATTLVVIVNHEFVFSRDIAMGANEFYEAIQQKIMTKAGSVEIKEDKAVKIIHDYGIPQEKNGIIPKLGISLYKLSIFLRPPVERLVNEINRSKNYFTKQFSEMSWDGVFIDGIGASFPHMTTVLSDNLELDVQLMNPTRYETFHFDDNVTIREQEISKYSLNFALLNNIIETFNILPKNTLASYRFIFLSKLAAASSAFILPFLITTLFFSNIQIKMMNKEVVEKTNQWETLSEQSQEYFDILKDLDIIDGYYKLLKNDGIHTKNVLKILKILSNDIDKNIKFTSLVFKKELTAEDKTDLNNPNYYDSVLEINGFVQSDPSLADIQLTNFQIHLEQIGVFNSIEREIKETSEGEEEWKLFFQFKLRW
ncbi:MAG: pilus assembly protein PilM [Fidelibacterota bacterium]